MNQQHPNQEDSTFTSIVSSLLSIKRNKPHEALHTYASDYHSSILKEAESLRALPHPQVVISASSPPPNYRFNHKAVHDENSSRRRSASHSTENDVSSTDNERHLKRSSCSYTHTSPASDMMRSAEALGPTVNNPNRKRQAMSDMYKTHMCSTDLTNNIPQPNCQIPLVSSSSSTDADLVSSSTDAQAREHRPSSPVGSVGIESPRVSNQDTHSGYWCEVYGFDASDVKIQYSDGAADNIGRGLKCPASAAGTQSRKCSKLARKTRTGFRNMGSIPVPLKAEDIKEEVAASESSITNSFISQLQQQGVGQTLSRDKVDVCKLSEVAQMSGTDNSGGYWQWIPASSPTSQSLPNGKHVPDTAGEVERTHQTQVAMEPCRNMGSGNFCNVPPPISVLALYSASSGIDRVAHDRNGVVEITDGYKLSPLAWKTIDAATTVSETRSSIWNESKQIV
mmetsp:Transcript_3382/g.5295  ORF Transcript_3382/g.5295 Transcript_3382/m.5295 type:complete len:452 (-) Transcript_3382:421-1776(-)|eukprot:CAMPEP_0185018368 /NCGR_PEP_ID=MMETSP1103-20130426/1118_1 /TAXON_ID=36769 /ORGANISM="Paraphysomonas bandaiensis, Strain Caron Lab Isolate" /LENGTH=451 /DNA_ID=CAMNT_0027548161 /DNA_START=132 /DNA_END=1487 /DNA_ORIENTATION=+